jgi:putative spermidine/putrescine transport system ATP-binding protein
VGTLNSLRAEVIDASAGLLRVDGHEVRAVAPLARGATGETVALALRPELLSVDGAGTQDNRLPGRVETISFLGSIVRIQVRIGASLILLDIFNNPHLSLPPIGSDVTVGFGREACLVLEGSVEKGAAPPVLAETDAPVS